MSGKFKFHVSRSLDERILKLIDNSEECDDKSTLVSSAYILGFNSGNVASYVGIATDYQLYHAALSVVGLVYFKANPTDEDVKSALSPVKEYSKSSNGLGSFKADKNENFFLIYNFNEAHTNQTEKRIFDLEVGTFLSEQPKLSILDDSKIYAHSAITKLNCCLKISMTDFENSIEEAKKCFATNNKEVKIYLKGSNYATNLASSDGKSVENLYDSLEPPENVTQMADYLPQMSKKDKEKLIEKWHNKVRSQRISLEFIVEHNELSANIDDTEIAGYYKLNLESFFYVHVNDSLAKMTKLIAYVIRNRLDLLKLNLIGDTSKMKLEPNEFKSCTFKPRELNYLVPIFYSIPEQRKPNYENLKAIRTKLHNCHFLPTTRPLFRFTQRVVSAKLENIDEQKGYLCNPHLSILDKSGIKSGIRHVVQGTYTYYHYKQNRIDDSGWGCAYRSLQTIISWLIHQGYVSSPDIKLDERKGDDKTSPIRNKLQYESRVPTHEEIQTILVNIGDKRADFVGSNKWIGSQEVCFVLDELYNIESGIISVSSGEELTNKARSLCEHFNNHSTPIMIGGGVLAHTILGIDFNEKNGDVSYLILDPHFIGDDDLGTVTKKGWCGWKKNSFWDKNSFYNLCLPHLPKEQQII